MRTELRALYRTLQHRYMDCCTPNKNIYVFFSSVFMRFGSNNKMSLESYSQPNQSGANSSHLLSSRRLGCNQTTKAYSSPPGRHKLPLGLLDRKWSIQPVLFKSHALALTHISRVWVKVTVQTEKGLPAAQYSAHIPPSAAEVGVQIAFREAPEINRDAHHFPGARSWQI